MPKIIARRGLRLLTVSLLNAKEMYYRPATEMILLHTVNYNILYIPTRNWFCGSAYPFSRAGFSFIHRFSLLWWVVAIGLFFPGVRNLANVGYFSHSTIMPKCLPKLSSLTASGLKDVPNFWVYHWSPVALTTVHRVKRCPVMNREQMIG